MAPDSDDPSSHEPDGGYAERTDAELYEIVRRAVEDAILGAVGTVLLVGVGVAVGGIGLSLLVGGLDLVRVAVGVVCLAFGAYLVAATLGVVPPAREWV
ncbi:hypothetical protein [Haloarcula litorea]|uniref:hypothetical protein n=1 Tax=Haloarcula litorea TaxID=3032579 RepID=UPI0023E82E8D|nr:hypothetical protein [Halomicroarcula sp. GDY20]